MRRWLWLTAALLSLSAVPALAFANPQVVLVTASKDSDIGEPGIYAYDLKAETYQLLAANTRPVIAF